jgi:hypothetical protein
MISWVKIVSIWLAGTLREPKFSGDGKSHSSASANDVKKEWIKTTFHRTRSNILGSLLKTDFWLAKFPRNRQTQNCRRLEQKEVQKVLGKQIPEPRTEQTAR